MIQIEASQPKTGIFISAYQRGFGLFPRGRSHTEACDFLMLLRENFPSTPRARNIGRLIGLMKSPQSFSRGNRSLSMSATEYPLRARKIAADDPAGPAPTIAISDWLTLIPELKAAPARERGRPRRV